MIRWLLVLLLPVLLAACSPGDVVPDEDETLAERVIADLRAGQRDKVIAAVLPDIREEIEQQFDRIIVLLPSDPAVRPELILANHVEMTSAQTGSISELTYALRGSDRQAAIKIGIRRDNGQAGIGQLFAGDLAKMETKYAFTLHDRSVVQYGFLLLMVMCFTVSVTAAILALRTPGLRWKWVWVIGSMIGITRLTMNWSTGQLMFEPLYVMLFGAGFFQLPLGPWFLQASPPVIAIVYLLFGHRFVRQKPR